MSEPGRQYTAIPDPDQFALLPLSGLHGAGRFAIVDAEDYDWLSNHVWHITRTGAGLPYVRRTEHRGGRTFTLLLHRVVLGFGPGDPDVDHIDGQTLDNRKRNLRPATSSQNNQNRRKKAGSSSTYKGVYLLNDKFRTRPWRAKIQVERKRVDLGCYATEEEAARAYNEAAVELFGEFACLNEIEGRG